MAFGKVQASSDGGSFKQYVGVGSFKVIGVNPTKDELSKFFGREIQDEPVYLSDKTDNDNKAYKQLRVSFMIQADLEDETGKPIKANAALTEPYKTTVNFFIGSRYRYNADKTKVLVIDKYGRTAWPTVEQAKNHQIPIYANGPAKLDKDFRPCYQGEDVLVDFIRNYLNISPIDSYNRNTGTWVENSNPGDCECYLDKIQDYFKGDISQLKEVCKLMPMNRIKLAVGIRTNNEGKQFGTVYTGATLRNGSNSYTYLQDSIAGEKQRGGLQDTVFSDSGAVVLEGIHEYKNNVKETDLSKPVDDPFAENNDGLPFDGPANDDPFADVA